MGIPKKHPSRADSLDWRASKVSSTTHAKSIAGFIFTKADLDRKIFGLPKCYEESVRSIRRGMPLFLLNTDRCLYGVYEAASDGGFNIDPYACDFESLKSSRYANPTSKNPAQVRVGIPSTKQCLSEDKFHSVLGSDGHRFKLELTIDQVRELLRLFNASERELKNRLNRPSYSVVPRELDSPRLAHKSDSDSYSDCSSKGVSSGEDDWNDESVNGKVLYRQGDEEDVLSERMDQILLDQSQCTSNDHFSTSPVTESQSGECFYDEQENTWKYSAQRNVTSAVTDFDNTMLLRLIDSDPAVSSIHGQSANVNHQENIVAVPMVTPQMQYSYPENMFFIPVQTVPCHQRENTFFHGQSQRSKWVEPKYCRGSSVRPRKQGWNQDRGQRSKDVRFMRQRVLPENEQAAVLPQQKLQFIFPICPPQRSGHVQEPTFVSPVLMPPNVEGLPFAGGRVDENIQGFEMANDGLQHMLQHYPIILVPSVIQRPPVFQSPLMPGFVEALHYEVLNFAKFTRPSADIQHHVEAAIDCVRKGVKAVWPEADVEVFGSFATGLCLQHSDVDLAVIDAPRIPSSENLSIAQASAALIRELAASLKTYVWCESINPLDTASMPVLKCVCRPFATAETAHIASPIAVDITIGGMKDGYFSCNPAARVSDLADQVPRPGKFSSRHTGGAAREYVLQKIRELPALAPLVLLLKSFLHHKDLSNVYSGGLGSFSLTLLVAFFLERVSPMPMPFDTSFSDGSSSDSTISSPLSISSEFSDDSDTPTSSSSFGVSSTSGDYNSQSLGEHYVRRAANAIQRVLCLWDQGGSSLLGNLLLGFLGTFGFHLDLSCEKIVLKGIDGSPGGIFKRDDKHVALWIDDPLRPGVNIGAGSYGMVHVQAAFKEMLQMLTDHSYSARIQCDDKDCQDIAAISQLPNLSWLTSENY